MIDTTIWPSHCAMPVAESITHCLHECVLRRQQLNMPQQVFKLLESPVDAEEAIAISVGVDLMNVWGPPGLW